VEILKDFYIPALQLAVRYDRLAGYFRSSSLAAASRGFSSFAGRQGRMRLIVVADVLGLFIGTYSGRGAEYLDPGTGQMAGVDREEVKGACRRIVLSPCMTATSMEHKFLSTIHGVL